ncbi:hypothetical protein P7K49_032053 [Saguinus oedipus]|uniref:Store-operated calcium entry-associated regulatory factor n=1 Tax=Saguinus oedipus TaxID=9490 RepID=A0ABQ9TX63_SAGOE|nr:hypothetical protein P7K49_032053 [Saguinus oedipus]
MLLRDVKVLTLHYDRYTTSRRLDPIPRLKCVGGTAGCDSYTPKVIQCQNKGWDGYESSEDQYVLRGSCGLEYNLDYTELCLKKLKESGKQHGFASFSDYYHKWYSADSCNMSGLITIVVLLGIAFRFTNPSGPPPPVFKSEFTGLQNTGRGATSGFGGAFAGQQGYENSGPGFWNGLRTGGLLGYLFGSNRAATPFSDSWYYPSYPPSYSGTWNSRAYSPLRGGLGSYSACSDSDTKTRTASGYGGTRRR